MVCPLPSKVLLHICCGICAGGVVQRLREEGYEVVGYFYNPNIYPLSEYKKRLTVAEGVAKILKFTLITEADDAKKWEKLTNGLGGLAEGGERCSRCYRFRLQKALAKANELGIELFTTTLTVSPHKNATVIGQIGQEIGGARFLVEDFKKHDGYKHSLELAKKHYLYRQHYCGCRYSLVEAERDHRSL